MLALIGLYAGGLAGRAYKSRLEIFYGDYPTMAAVVATLASSMIGK